MTKRIANSKRYPIKARSHLLHLLGDELIGDDRLAVFELVKNGYDADANNVDISLVFDKAGDSDEIIVEDDGHGMDMDDITGKWLEIATDSKRAKRNKRSAKYNRLPLGEKGVGRLAAFKLGAEVTLTTKKQDSPEIVVTVNVDDLILSEDYIEKLGVEVIQRPEPIHFSGNSTGTLVRISHLKRKDWKRGDVRALFRLVTSLSSPFETPEAFSVTFNAPGRESDYKDMLKPDEFLEQSIWKYTFSIENGDFNWTYEFKPPHWKGVRAKSLRGKSEALQLTPLQGSRKGEPDNESLILKGHQLQGIGPISGVIYAYYRRPEVLRASRNQNQLKSWLDDQTGVRVYRDGVRVFNYGEPHDDWLGLNAKRINAPTGRLGTKSLISAVNLKLEDSWKLKEKTNREGFEQSEAYEDFHRVVNSIFEHFGQLHTDDRKVLDHAIKGREPSEKSPAVHEAVEDLKTRLKKHPEFQVIKRDLEAIEDQFEQVRDVMVGAGIAGLNLAVVFHEVERGVDALDASTKRGDDIKSIRKHIEHIQSLLNTFAPLLRKNPVKNVFVSDLVQAAIEMRRNRFKFHNIVVSAPILTKEEPDFKVAVPANLLVGALGNVLDNAIYWTQYRRDRDEPSQPAAIRVVTHKADEASSGLIAVVDNGPGFTIPTDKAAEPFVTRRPGGMGLGLYYVNLVMEQCGGLLTVSDASDLRDELDVPDAYDGAAVALRFGGSA